MRDGIDQTTEGCTVDGRSRHVDAISKLLGDRRLEWAASW